MRVLLWLMATTVSLALTVDESRADAVKFPFPVEIDAANGETGGLPNRVKHKQTGLLFVLVPAGEYRIGDDNLADSAEITVKLSAYYVAEREVAKGVIAAYLKWRLDTAMVSEVKLGEQKPTDDELLAVRLAALTFHELGWPFDIDLDSETSHRRDVLWREMEEQARSGDTDLKFQLSAAQREETLQILAKAEEGIKRLGPDADRRYGMAHFRNAGQIAEWAKARLLTEAEWEAAAKLHDEGKLPTIVNMLDHDVFEWCSDYYAHDYFRRKADLTNPTGPQRGKFSDEQIEAEVAVSSTRWATRLAARSAGVLRGGGVSKRRYARRGTLMDSSGVAKGIRLAFTAPTVENK
ncbi:MAG: hypothetical protein WD875_15790 [Pirellulales bacterium]